jgi:hypothetical protein
VRGIRRQRSNENIYKPQVFFLDVSKLKFEYSGVASTAAQAAFGKNYIIRNWSSCSDIDLPSDSTLSLEDLGV